MVVRVDGIGAARHGIPEMKSQLLNKLRRPVSQSALI
jgi:hypothetical protein